jgi:hypothetical protein
VAMESAYSGWAAAAEAAGGGLGLPTSAGPTSLSFVFLLVNHRVRFLPARTPRNIVPPVGANNYHYRRVNWFSFPSYLQRSHSLFHLITYKFCFCSINYIYNFCIGKFICINFAFVV